MPNASGALSKGRSTPRATSFDVAPGRQEEALAEMARFSEACSDLREALSQFAALKRQVHPQGPMRDWPYRSSEEFCLQLGRFWEPAPLPEKFETMLPKECFHNALLTAMMRKELTYVEGFVLAVIPLHHAWLVDAAGKVFDPTLPDADRLAFWGVPFDTRFILNWATKKGTAGCLEDWQQHWPFESGKFKPEQYLSKRSFPKYDLLEAGLRRVRRLYGKEAG